MNKNIPSLADIQMAHKLILDYIHQTPVYTSEIINSLAQANLFFKCENFQKSGAFKFRGASHTLIRLRQDGFSGLVITHSSGNHAGALAKASALFGFNCLVVMPENAPRVKVEAVKHYGASIRFCKPTLQAREETTNLLIKETGATLIHPYDNVNIIAGQGTAALELLENYPNLDCIITPVGGGGLLSGTAICAKALNRTIRVFGAEPTGADDAYRSLKAGILIPSQNPKSIADGLLTSLSERTFYAMSRFVDGIIPVSEEEIIFSMKLIWQHMKIIIEPSSATVLAAVLNSPDLSRGKNIGLILSGGNIQLSNLPFN